MVILGDCSEPGVAGAGEPAESCALCSPAHLPAPRPLQVCPSCRDICNCKKCLQTRNPVNLPAYSEAQQRECAAYLLASVAAPLGELLEEWGAEVRGCCRLLLVAPAASGAAAGCWCAQLCRWWAAAGAKSGQSPLLLPRRAQTTHAAPIVGAQMLPSPSTGTPPPRSPGTCRPGCAACRRLWRG
jgi:hypothetical protein